MKKFLKRKNDPSQSTDESASRITNETVAEHREKVLAGGRKFKYPLQYQRHKLIVNTLIIGIMGKSKKKAFILWVNVKENGLALITMELFS